MSRTGAGDERTVERLRTPTALLRWLLVVAEIALLGTVLAVNLLGGTARTIAVGTVATAATVLLVRWRRARPPGPGIGRAGATDPA